MADRNDRNRGRRSYRDNDYMGSRQAEQFQDTPYEQDGDYGPRDDQMNEGRGYRPANFYYEEVAIIPRRRGGPRGNDDRGYGQRESMRGGSEYGDYDYQENAYGPSRQSNRERGFEPFTSEDQGGRDFIRGDRGGYSDYGRRGDGYAGGYGGGGGSGSRGGYRDRYDRDDRGFFDKAGDEIASWFGDEDAARRREMDHRGRGPGNYTRSDERILEDACDTLTDDWAVDARNIQVTVKDAEVTLDGTVDSRSAKRRAEDCVHDISGVKHVQNNLRIEDRDDTRSGGTYVDEG